MERALEIQSKENADLKMRLEMALTENTLLRQKIQVLMKRIFGSKSEKIDPAQLQLLLAGLQDLIAVEPIDSEPSPDKPRSSKKRDKSKPVLPADIPLYRQERIMREAYGINLPRKTMADWMGITAEWLRPIYRLIGEGVRSGGYMQIDETPVKYLQSEEGGSRKGYFWVYNKPGGDVYFEWHTSRASDCLNDMLWTTGMS